MAKQFPHINIIGEEGDDNDVPPEWIVSQSDPEVLKLKCPDKFSNVPDKDVRFN